MKKVELLKMPWLGATMDMMQTAREDEPTETTESWTGWNGKTYRTTRRHYEYNLFFSAVVENDILKVAVFVREWLMRGECRPQFEIYLSKTENRFQTWDVEEKKWREAKVNMLPYDYGNDYSCLFAGKNYQSTFTRRLVNEYLGTGNMDVKEAILDFQWKENFFILICKIWHSIFSLQSFKKIITVTGGILNHKNIYEIKVCHREYGNSPMAHNKGYFFFFCRIIRCMLFSTR